MPATAGRVRMPANNRVHSSAALQTHGIWQSAIGYDPYAPTAKDKDSSEPAAERASDSGENAYANFQGLLALARITNSSGAGANETRGACKRYGRVGHLTFQCRNFLSVKDDRDTDGPTASAQAATVAFEKMKKTGGCSKGESDESEDEEGSTESDSSDSDIDPEMEKIIARRFGKKWTKTEKGNGEEDRRGNEKRRKRHQCSSDDEDDSDRRKGRKRKSHRHHHHHRQTKRRRNNDDSEVAERKSHRRHHHHRHRLARRN